MVGADKDLTLLGSAQASGSFSELSILKNHLHRASSPYIGPGVDWVLQHVLDKDVRRQLPYERRQIQC